MGRQIKLTDDEGRQLVKVEFAPGGIRYTYAWGGPGRLRIGDVVETPTPAWFNTQDWADDKPQPGRAVVVELGTTWFGTTVVLAKKLSAS
jgi:hypothetical protein